jgi:hypothetical protein
MSILSVSLALLAAAAEPVGPQDPSSVEPAAPITGTPSAVAVGQRVRVTSTTLKRRIEAAVASFDDTTLTVRSKTGMPVAIPWSTVSAMDVQVGYRRPLLESAVGGAAIGALIGLFVHLDKTCGTPEETPDAVCSRAESVGLSALAMSMVSFGSQFLFPADRVPKWHALAPPFREPAGTRPVSLRLVPARQGIGAQVTLRF